MNLYEKIQDAQNKIKEGTAFLEDGLRDKSLMKLKNGEIRPRYCQYCEETRGLQRKPIVWTFEFTDPRLEEFLKSNPYNYDELREYAHRELLAKGYNTKVLNNHNPLLVSGKQYLVRCDCCGISSYWWQDYDSAMREFDEIIQQQIEFYLQYEDDYED